MADVTVGTGGLCAAAGSGGRGLGCSAPMRAPAAGTGAALTSGSMSRNCCPLDAVCGATAGGGAAGWVKEATHARQALPDWLAQPAQKAIIPAESIASATLVRR